MKNLYTKIHKFNSKVGIVAKDSNNPFFKSKYADLNAILDVIRPTMNEVGLAIIQPLNSSEHGLELTTILADTESGEEIKSVILLPNNPDPQKQGAIITYFRRFAIQSLLVLQAEDTDGNETQAPKSEQAIYCKKVNDKTNESSTQPQPQTTSGIPCPQCGQMYNGKYATCWACSQKKKQLPLNQPAIEEKPPYEIPIEEFPL